MTEAETRTPAAIALAADTLGRDLLDTIMQHVANLPGWNMASSSSKEAALRDFKGAVERMVRETIQVVGSGQFPACQAMLSSINFGDSITVKLKVDRNANGRHELIDMAGAPVMILMAAPDDYLARMQDVREHSKQRSLFPDLEGEDGPVDLLGMPLDALCECGHDFTTHGGIAWTEGMHAACTDKACDCQTFKRVVPPQPGDLLFGGAASGPSDAPTPENPDADDDDDDDDDD